MDENDPFGVTIADVLARLADELEATCQTCTAIWRAPASILPIGTTLANVAASLACPACGDYAAKLAPVWFSSAKDN